MDGFTNASRVTATVTQGRKSGFRRGHQAVDGHGDGVGYHAVAEIVEHVRQGSFDREVGDDVKLLVYDQSRALLADRPKGCLAGIKPNPFCRVPSKPGCGTARHDNPAA